ncbi:hypothetical protein [Kordia jejudonensis]|uniref:hypothetical protein n=1 Tax=Kordia jejudonensis TaxID=1348245 RepID=UPI0006295068|nr:hypothetical protein [Kordia jejudonensis]
MKKYITIFSFLIIISCAKNEHINDDELINDFIRNIFLVENYEVGHLNKYMTDEYLEKYENLSKEESEKHEEYIKSILDKIKKTLLKNDNNYEIIEEKKLNKEKFLDYYDILYEGEGRIYRLIVNKRITTFFIVENQKIHSFCLDFLQSSKGKVIPYFFFEE